MGTCVDAAAAMNGRYRALVAAGRLCGAKDAAVFAVMMDHADDDGVTHVADLTIADLCGINRRTVVAARRRLAQSGLVETAGRASRGGREVAIWRIPALCSPEPESAQPATASEDAPVSTRCAHGVHSVCSECASAVHSLSTPERESAHKEKEKEKEKEGARSPHCIKHPDGTDEPCRGCMTARQSFQAWEARRQAEREANATCKHGRLRGHWLDEDGVSLGACVPCEREAGCLAETPAVPRNLRSVVSSIGRAV